MFDVKALFIDETFTLRSGWRAAFFLLAFAIASSILVIIFELTGGKTVIGPMPFIVIGAFFTLISALIVGAFCGRMFESLPLHTIVAVKSGNWLKNFALGSIFGTLTLVVAVAITMIGGGQWFRFNTEVEISAVANSLAVSFIIFSVAAAAEEALFRGYVLQTLTRSGYAWLAIALTSIPFGIAHLNNPNAGIISTINTVLAGVWFGVAYLKTRDLWFVWGLHLMWNFVQGSIFGIEVSGLTDLSTSPLLKEIDNGPHWLTGTTYGIEGGIACTIALVLSTVCILLITFPRSNDEMFTIPSPEASLQ